MSTDERINEMMNMLSEMKAQMDKQDEKLDYIVSRLNHMRDKAHEARENKTSWNH